MSNRQLEIQVKHLGDMSIHTSPNDHIMRQDCLGYCASHRIEKRWWLPLYRSTYYKTGILSSWTTQRSDTVRTFSPGGGSSPVPQAGVRKQQGKPGSGLRMLHHQRANAQGTSEEDCEMPAITVKNRACGFRYLLNRSALQTQSCVSQEQGVFHAVHFSD